MRKLREFVCEKIYEDDELYGSFSKWLSKNMLDINFILWQDKEDIEVLKVINKFFNERENGNE